MIIITQMALMRSTFGDELIVESTNTDEDEVDAVNGTGDNVNNEENFTGETSGDGENSKSTALQNMLLFLDWNISNISSVIKDTLLLMKQGNLNNQKIRRKKI